jgi:hypothetical protein
VSEYPPGTAVLSCSRCKAVLEIVYQSEDRVLKLTMAGMQCSACGHVEPLVFRHGDAADRMTDAQRDAVIDDIMANPEKYKKSWTDKARAENPQMTEEQLEWSWRQLCQQLGL